MSKLVCKKNVFWIPRFQVYKLMRKLASATSVRHILPLVHRKKNEYLARIEELFEQYGGKGNYDVVYALSGGKDSSYTLYKLKKKTILSLRYWLCSSITGSFRKTQ